MCYREPCLEAGENGKTQGRIQSQTHIKFPSMWVWTQGEHNKSIFSYFGAYGPQAQGKGSSPSCNSLSHTSTMMHTKLMGFLSVTFSKCVFLLPGCLGHFVRLPCYLAPVPHLVMHIPLWDVTGGNVQQKHPHRTDWELLGQPVHPCKDSSTPWIPAPSQSTKRTCTSRERSWFSTAKGLKTME